MKKTENEKVGSDEQTIKGEEPEKILLDFVTTGFEAIIVSVRGDVLSKEWLGHRVDEDFLQSLRQADIHLCGEKGEYHTLVIDGPTFKKRLSIPGSNQVYEHGGWWFSDIAEYELVPKRSLIV